ncbi:hypothetical protein [Oscillibacter sp.]|uniref:hypothetical protein n=1 Tax=Oscillibacter sp. TaxID=1945593 RepID=UPI0028A05938|nr:hypothetical protein [Oscillibacter sp.]
MEELRKKTIAALTKQVELLSKDGNALVDRELTNTSVQALTGLLHELMQVDYAHPLMAE